MSYDWQTIYSIHSSTLKVWIKDSHLVGRIYHCCGTTYACKVYPSDNFPDKKKILFMLLVLEVITAARSAATTSTATAVSSSNLETYLFLSRTSAAAGRLRRRSRAPGRRRCSSVQRRWRSSTTRTTRTPVHLRRRTRAMKPARGREAGTRDPGQEAAAAAAAASSARRSTTSAATSTASSGKTETDAGHAIDTSCSPFRFVVSYTSCTGQAGQSYVRVCIDSRLC